MSLLLHPSPARKSSLQAGVECLSTDPAVTSIREFLAFKLGREEYGIDILRVQEIRSYEHPTRMTNAPSLQRHPS